MKIGDIIQRVQSLYSKGAPSNSTRLSSRHIYNVLLTVRARVIVQEIRKGRNLSEWDLQPIHGIEMIPQTPVNCGDSSRCAFMKSKYALPQGLTADETESVVISNYNGSSHFSRTTFENYKFIGGNKYTGTIPHYFIHDNYLYLLNSSLKTAYAHGIWRDPIEAYRLHLLYQNKSTCINNQDIDFFTPLEIVESILQLTKIELIEQFLQIQEDTRNDSSDRAN